MKTVIWDYNGTIIDDVRLCLAIENHMLAERGMKHDWTLDEYRRLFGFPVKDYYYRIGYTFENETYEEVADEFSVLYDRGFYILELTDGFREFITSCKEKRYRNVILSASRTDKLRVQCQKLGIYDLFDEVMGVDDLLAGSKIALAKNWMAKAAVKPEECVYIGDTVHDKQTAKAIGVSRCLLIAAGHQSRQVLEEAHDEVYDSLREAKL